MAGVAMDNDDYAKAATLFEQAMDVNVKCATTYMFRAQVRTTEYTFVLLLLLMLLFCSAYIASTCTVSCIFDAAAISYCVLYQ
jgi:hypothetical protein